MYLIKMDSSNFAGKEIPLRGLLVTGTNRGA